MMNPNKMEVFQNNFNPKQYKMGEIQKNINPKI